MPERADMDVRAIGPGTYLVTRGDRTCTAYAVAIGDQCWVFVDGHVVVVDRAGGRPGARRGGAGASHSLTAPMPATVVSVVAAQGQAVRKGETLLVLEAMKMELVVKAPADGVVKSIRCRQGDLVQPDAPLIDFE